MLTETQIQEFKPTLRGQLVRPGDPTYDTDRKIYNGMIDKRPALIARCHNVADVIQAVNFGRENKLDIAIRSGGHHGAGLSLVDNGLVIDLSLMKGIRVDPQAKTVSVQAGCTWADVDHATHAFGMATPSGIFASTGVGGLTLGGGTGNLTRSFGLTIDNLLEADVVLADGSFVTANEKTNPDLFWALRGGGGNFGVVTNFVYRLHPVSMVYGGPIFWEFKDAEKVMRYWRDYIMTAPETENSYFAFHSVPPVDMFPKEYHTQKMGVIVWCCTGTTAEAEEAIRPFRNLVKPAIDFAGPMPFTALQMLFDPIYPPGLQWYWNADFFNELSDEMIAIHLKHFAQVPNIFSGMHFYTINGAPHRLGRNDTAWSYRDANFNQVIVGVDPDPANKDVITRWSKTYWQALHPHSAGGGYVNMMMDEGMDRVKASYRDNYPRLAQIKQKYDPTNLFHVNQNIKPAG